MAKPPLIPTAVVTVHRFIFVIAFGVTGFVLGREIDLQLLATHLENGFWQNVLRLAAPIIGAFIGVSISPFAQGLFEMELAQVEAASERLAPCEIIGGTIGLCAGLFIALLLRTLFSGLITAFGTVADVILVLAAVIFGIFSTYFGVRVGSRAGAADAPVGSVSAPIGALLDTSAIIDGRMLEVVRAGFHNGPFIVPRFILAELQNIADSSDPLRRVRGRRGLELLDTLRALVDVRIDGDLGAADLAVDARLLQLARERKLQLVTTDFNLHRVARLEGVTVLNVNELAQALRPVLVAGESLDVLVTREGREADQGVGYLDDGTMIVVEGGRSYLGEAIAVVVTSVLQTAAGRMVFARVQ